MSQLPDRHAAVIGIDAYGHGVAPLSSAVADARAIARALEIDHGYDAVHLLLDTAATRDGILVLLEETLPHGLSPDSGVVVYYAGHGQAVGEGSSPRGFLVPQDARLDCEGTWLSMDLIRKALGKLPCRHLLVVLDCCYAGSFRWATTRRMVPTGRRLYESQYYRYLLGTAWQVLTSASHDEKAIDLERDNRGEDAEGHSPFAAALLRGLAGDADSWRGGHDADGVMTVTELLQYVFEELVRPVEKWPQTPGLWPLEPDNTGEFIFLSPRQEPQLVPDPPLDDAHNPWLGLEETRIPDPGLAQLRELLIEEPALSMALFFEPGELVDELLDKVNDMPGAVPLLALTLAEMYRRALLRRQQTGALDRALTRRDYEAVEGVTGFVRRRWSQLLGEAGEAGLEATIRRLASRMVSFESWGRSRRRVSRRELEYADPEAREEVERALDLLTDRHLVVAGGEYLELAHDALAQDWPEEAAETQQLLRAVWRAATAWDDARRAPKFLWHDDRRLPQVRAIRGELNRLERQFLEGSEDSARVAVARELISQDPTRAALVLLEVTLPDETPYAVSTMLEALGQPLIQSVVRSGARWSDVMGGDDPPESFVCSAAFDTEGTRILTGSTDGTVRVWHVDGRRAGEAVVLEGHQELVYSVAFNADGTEALAAAMDGTVRVWNLAGADGQPPCEPMELSVEEGHLTCAAFDAVGTKIVAGLQDGTVRVWSLDVPDHGLPGEPLAFGGNQGTLWSAAFNADGTKILTVSRAVEVWKADGGSSPILSVPVSDVFSAGLSADGTRVVVTRDEEDEAWVWQVDEPGEPVVLQGHDGPVVRAAFNPDGSEVVTASVDETARVWHSDGTGWFLGPRMMVLRGHQGPVTSACFNAAGDRVVTAATDLSARNGTVRVWKWNEYGESWVGPVFRVPDCFLMIGAAFNRSGTRVLTVSIDAPEEELQDRQARSADSEVWGPYGPFEDSMAPFWEMPKSAYVWDVDGSGGLRVLRGDRAAFSADGTRVLTVTSGTVLVWRVDGPDGGTASEPVVLRLRDDDVVAAALSTDGTRILTACSGGSRWSRRWTAEVWNADGSGKPFVRALQDGDQDTNVDGDRIVFSPDGSKVLLLAEDGIARVWNTDGSGKPVLLPAQVERYDDYSVVSGAFLFSPDGTRILADTRETVRVWELVSSDGSTTGEPVILPDGGSARFSADGTKVLTVSGGTARVWQADGTGELFVLRGEVRGEAHVTFNGDGTRVLVPDGRTARVWATDRRPPGEPVAVVEHERSIGSATFSADGTRVLSITSKDARVWNADGSGAPVDLKLRVSREGYSYTFSADGTRVLLAATDDGSLWLWSAGDADESIEIRGHVDSIDTVAFSGDGARFLTSGEGTTRVWPLAGARLQDAIRAATTLRLEPEERVRYLGESPETAWKKHAEGELGDGRCPRAWGFDPADPESAAPFLSRLSDQARERFEACEARRRKHE